MLQTMLLVVSNCTKKYVVGLIHQVSSLIQSTQKKGGRRQRVSGDFVFLRTLSYPSFNSVDFFLLRFNDFI